jgi:hypothetical protein
MSKSSRSRRVTLVWIFAGLAGFAHAQTVLSPRWSHQSGAENWVAREVSLGNEGTEVFTQLDVGGLSRRLFTEGASGTAPLWQSSDTQSTFHQRVASAADASLHVSARDALLGTQHRLELRPFTSGSAAPLWTWTSPLSNYAYDKIDVLVTRGGERIVLVNYAALAARTEVRVFAPASAVPLHAWTVDTYGPSIGARLSRDGSTLCVLSTLAANIVDTASGVVVHRSSIVGQAGGAIALSGDGRAFAIGIGGSYRLVREDSQGVWATAWERALPMGTSSNQLAIAEDGSRLACAYALYSGTYAVSIELLDLPASQSAPAVMWTRTIDGAGALQDRASDLALSADGRTLVAGLWGDDGGSSPEIVVFKDDAPVPAFLGDSAGSVQRLALSADGRHLAAASKARHNTVFSGDGSVDYFDLGAQDLRVQGVPHAGGSVTIAAHTTPGRPVKLVFASQKAHVPTVLGAMGTLYLNRATILGTQSMGAANGQGDCQTSFALGGAAVGTSVYFQALALAPRQLGLDWCKVTVVP